MIERRAVPHLTQHGLNLRGGKPELNHVEQLSEDRAIRLGEKMLGFRGQPIIEVWLAQPAPETAVAYQPVALKRGQVRTHCVGRQSEGRGQFVDSAVFTAQQAYNLPPRGGQKVSTP